MSVVVIVTYSDYPNGSPGAIRYATFAHTYANMGYDVMVLNKSCTNREGTIKTEAVAYGNRYKRIILFCYRVIKNIKNLNNDKEVTAVILGSDIIAPYACIIQSWCRRNNISCIIDATEWYSKEQFAHWWLSFNYWEKDCLNRYVINKHSRVIAISSYLYEYFTKKGCAVVSVPIIYNPNLQNQNPIVRRISDSGLNLIYAGSHLLMDNIPLIIEAISLLSEYERKKVHFYVYGIEKSKLLGCVSEDTLNTVRESLHIMGRRPHNEVLNAYSNSDFCIMLRNPNLRVNQAGFPSKVVECMEYGIPVICNYSSDLDQYLEHMKNSIIIDQLDATVISATLKEILYLTKAERIKLGENANNSINNRLDSRLFADSLREIIK